MSRGGRRGRKFVSGRKKRSSCVRCSRRRRPANLIVEIADARNAAPQENVRVYITQSGTRSRSGVTDATGHARFDNVDPGVAGIMVSREDEYLGRTSRYLSPGTTTLVVFRTTSTEPGRPNRLARVGVLDGGPGIEAGASVYQYVNLPVESKWVDGGYIKNRYRLGREIHFKVHFRYEGAESFRWRVIEARSGQTTYSSAERSHAEYTATYEDWQSDTTDSNGVKVLKCKVPVCGGNAYRIEARDTHGVTRRSAVIHVRRRVYLQPVAMPRNGRVQATSTSNFRAKFRSEKLYLRERRVARMDLIENISDTRRDVNRFKREARQGYNGSGARRYEPYIVCLAFTEHLAVRDSDVRFRKTNVRVGPGQATVRIPLVDGAGRRRSLWRNIVSGEDWFASARFYPNGSSRYKSIPRDNCTPIGASWNSESCEDVDIDVTDVAEEVMRGRIDLKVHVVNRMRGGVSYGDGNLICVCRKAWWRDTSVSGQNETMAHEMGHKVYMVPSGSNSDLDRLSNQYDNRRGHVGSHCRAGLPLLPNYSNSQGHCIMFGSSNRVGNRFCGDCRAAIRKIDISAGWERF